jgi:hypothetical protein
MWHASCMLHRVRTFPHSIHTLVCLTNTQQPNNYLSLKSHTYEIISWKIWEFHYLLYLNLRGREQWFGFGYQEQTGNSGDAGWTVTNSGSEMGIGRRHETMTMLDEQSQTVVQQWALGRDVKQWRCWKKGHKRWFSNGCWEETWNNDDVGWKVTNGASAMGIGKRRETMTMLDERSQTKSTLVIT